jgi:hypothetical protein
MYEPSGRILNQGEAALYLGIKPCTLVRLRLNGRGPRFTKFSKKFSAKYMYTVYELDRWLKEGIFEELDKLPGEHLAQTREEQFKGRAPVSETV